MTDSTPIAKTLSNNVQEVKERIKLAAERSGRTAEDVRLVAVTKYVGVELTSMLVEAGVHCLGESRPQVLWDKAEKINDPNVEWHMIGHLQRNKVKRTVAVVDTIHSVDSEKLLAEIENVAAQQDKVVNVLLEVNVSGDSNKNGVMPDRVDDVLESALSKENVRPIGLMGMGGLTSSESDVRDEFAQLRELRDRLANGFFGNLNDFSQLSMGMSNDFEIAIEQGATLVRIGSVLFQGIERS